jgi:hypothetical protein
LFSQTTVSFVKTFSIHCNYSIFKSEISGSEGCQYEDDSLLGCLAAVTDVSEVLILSIIRAMMMISRAMKVDVL